MRAEHIFILTSKNCSQTSSRLYGYCLHEGSIYCNHTPLGEEDAPWLAAPLVGMYVALHRAGKILDLTVDSGGFGRVYLFRQGSFWALSNSFYALYKYLREHFPLTLNGEYAAQFLLLGMTPVLSGESLCQEISLVSSQARIRINLDDATLSLQKWGVPPAAIPLDSEEGVHLVDTWIDQWKALLRGIVASGSPLEVDLSGGFDSRATLALLLAADVDLAAVNISEHPLYTLCEDDRKIPKIIAESCGFRLRACPTPVRAAQPEESYTVFKLARWGCHKAPNFYEQLPAYRCFRLTGYGAELHKGTWYMPPAMFAAQHISTAFGPQVQEDALRGLMRSTCEIKKSAPPVCTGEDIMVRIYQRSRMRLHFGSLSMKNFMEDTISLSPFSDPLLLQLEQRVERRGQRDLLHALIMERIGKQMQNIPYDRGGAFSEESRNKASALNKKFPAGPDKGSQVLCRIVAKAAPDENIRPLSQQSTGGQQEALDLLWRDVEKALPRFRRHFLPIPDSVILANKNWNISSIVGAIVPISDFLSR